MADGRWQMADDRRGRWKSMIYRENNQAEPKKKYSPTSRNIRKQTNIIQKPIIISEIIP